MSSDLALKGLRDQLADQCYRRCRRPSVLFTAMSKQDSSVSDSTPSAKTHIEPQLFATVDAISVAIGKILIR